MVENGKTKMNYGAFFSKLNIVLTQSVASEPKKTKVQKTYQLIEM